MAGEDLNLKIIIEAIANAKGFEDAQKGLAALAATTNSVVPATEGLATAQRVSSREIRLATAEVLHYSGVTQEAGLIGRFAAVGFRALGDSAEFANVAIVGATIGLSVIIPKIIEWIGRTKEQTKEQKYLAETLESSSGAIEGYGRRLKEINETLRDQLAAHRQFEMNKESQEVYDLTQKYLGMKGALNATNEEVKGAIARIKDITAAHAQGITVAEMYAKVTDKQAEAEHRAAKEEKELHTEEVQLANAVEAVYRREEKLLELRKKESAIRHQRALEEKKEEEQHKKDLDLAAQEVLWSERQQGEIIKEAKVAIEAGKIKRAEDARNLDSAASYYLSFFGKNKAARIAQAIADTYAAATRALAEGGPYLGPVLAAAMIAAGLKNISEIQKTKVGFDDPFNDIIASRLGRKSAADFVEHFGVGFREGMRAGGGAVYNQTTTINRGTTMNVTAHGIIGSRTAFRSWLEREMTLAERVRARKTI